MVMKRIVLLSIASFSFLSATASAEVTPAHTGLHSPTADVWTAGVSRELGQALRGAYRFGDKNLAGAVVVQFECAPDGAPHKIALVRRSGSLMANRRALRAVQNIRTLHPLPAAFREDQQYQATIIFAQSEEAANRLRGLLRKEAERRPVASRGANPALAVNIVAVTPG
jgi:periplasmic protein TonB